MKKTNELMSKKDFINFLKTPSHDLPSGVAHNIHRTIHKKLVVSPFKFFVKLSLIHIVVGTLSLAICNQFELNPFNTRFSLSHYFMKWGHSACMILCGFLFISLSIYFSKLFLSQQELLLLKKQAPLHIAGLTIISILSFLLLGAVLTLTMSLLWVASAMGGGLFAVKTLYIKGESYGSS